MHKHVVTARSTRTSQPGERRCSLSECLRYGLLCYCLTGVFVVCGVLLGFSVFRDRPRRSPDRAPQSGVKFLDTLTQWDGQWYHKIALEGYTYDPKRMSTVAFFPLFPSLGGCLSWMTGAPADVTLVVISHLFLIASYGLLIWYVRERFSDNRQRLGRYVLLAFCLWPISFFMWMAYSESLFIFLSILALCGMERRWSPLVIAYVIGLATASRAVGVALLVPFVLHVWERNGRLKNTVGQLAYLVPIGCWGILGYMLSLQLDFGEPLAFAQTQENWRMAGRPSLGLGERALVLLSWEPIWSTYDLGSPGYWATVEKNVSPFLSLQFANPIFFVLAGALIYVGAVKAWLSKYEVLLALGLIVIPYVTRGYEMCMASHARYVTVAFPIYLVLGNLLCRAPMPVRIGMLALSAVYLAVYSATLAGGYLVI